MMSEERRKTPPDLKGELDQEAIKRIIEHREPFLFVNRVTELTDTYAAGYKHVRGDEFFFKGHFPGNPVLPGVIMVESLAQIAGVQILSQLPNRGKAGYFASIDKVKFRGVVRPDCDLKLEANLIKAKKRFIYSAGKASVDGKLACECEFILFLANGGQKL